MSLTRECLTLIQIPVLPFVHGTNLNIARKICTTGFANLSTLVCSINSSYLKPPQDDGYYGKGIYFSSYALYTFPYFKSKEQPAIILSWVVPGNVYPVTENPFTTKSILGYVEHLLDEDMK